MDAELGNIIEAAASTAAAAEESNHESTGRNQERIAKATHRWPRRLKQLLRRFLGQD